MIKIKKIRIRCWEKILLDLIVISLVPLVLILLFNLPDDIREQLVLHHNYSNGYDILTTHFVHDEATHLKNNIIGYLIFILPLYFLLHWMNMRNLFYFFLLLNLIFMPLLLSFIWIPINIFIFPQVPRNLGFSGINSAFLGMLGYSYALLLHKKLNVRFVNIFLIFLLFGLGVIPITYSKWLLTDFIAIIVIWSLFILLYYKTIKELDLQKAKNLLAETKKNFILGIMLILPLVIYIIGLGPTFPKEIRSATSIINIISHYSGFLLGFIVPYILFNLLLTRLLKQFIS